MFSNIPTMGVLHAMTWSVAGCLCGKIVGITLSERDKKNVNFVCVPGEIIEKLLQNPQSSSEIIGVLQKEKIKHLKKNENMYACVGTVTGLALGIIINYFVTPSKSH